MRNGADINMGRLCFGKELHKSPNLIEVYLYFSLLSKMVHMDAHSQRISMETQRYLCIIRMSSGKFISR